MLSQWIDFLLHADKHLAVLVTHYGFWIYGLLFLIVFIETGLVVMPFLPGDSLLFAAGALAGVGTFDPMLLLLVLFIAAVLGDSCNYAIGNYLGSEVYRRNYRWLRKDYLDMTHAFFERHGGKAVVIARFMPIIRTFTPFVAGVGGMNYARFLLFNVTGAALWVGSFVGLGFFFGNLPTVKENFTLVLLAIIILSLLPGFYGYARVRWLSRT